ncbi:MAG: hypothetical protein HWQ23_15335 [Nostoc sp. JL33]|uniref:hypothetical protein n=1 Tax=Nostoc sp. JL33 TaxID=2815396 RepID=UPI0025D05DA5|nr:hypothetical protein [Nostoc sp. JL33]MBN3871594.1 hypothetical protein [Nostoc sp. JL33]
MLNILLATLNILGGNNKSQPRYQPSLAQVCVYLEIVKSNSLINTESAFQSNTQTATIVMGYAPLGAIARIIFAEASDMGSTDNRFPGLITINSSKTKSPRIIPWAFASY